jgi:hypothetical protein
MIRTQVQLAPAQAEALKREAAARGVSMAELVREAVDRYLAGGGIEPRRQRAIEAVGGFRSGRGDVSADHDRHLAEAFGD